MHTFNFEFQELPLAITPGIEAALINGMAEVEYAWDGVFQIKAVYVEGYKHITQAERDAGVKPWVYIPAPPAIEFIVLGRLNHEWLSKVREAIAEQIADDRESAIENAADMRRSHREDA